MFGSLAIMVLTMIFPFDSIYQQRGALVFYKTTIQLIFSHVLPSSNKPPGISTVLWHCTTYRGFFLVRPFSSVCQSTGSGLSLTGNIEYLLLAIPFLDVVAIR